MRRKDREQDSAFALKVVENCNYGIVAKLNSDNTPYCIPVSPVLMDNAIYFHCANEGLKVENIKNNPNVCFTCVGHTKLLPEMYSTEYESAVVKGTCTFVTDNQEKISALRVICEKFASSHMAGFDAEIAKFLDKTTVCKIALKEVTGKAHIK